MPESSLIEDGEWKAEYFLGVGFEVMGQALASGVSFTHVETGRELEGRVCGIGRASAEELLACLQDAKRRAEFEEDND